MMAHAVGSSIAQSTSLTTPRNLACTWRLLQRCCLHGGMPHHRQHHSSNCESNWSARCDNLWALQHGIASCFQQQDVISCHNGNTDHESASCSNSSSSSSSSNKSSNNSSSSHSSAQSFTSHVFNGLLDCSGSFAYVKLCTKASRHLSRAESEENSPLNLHGQGVFQSFPPSSVAPSSFAPSSFIPSSCAPSSFARSSFAPSSFIPSSCAPSSSAPSSSFAPISFAPSKMNSTLCAGFTNKPSIPRSSFQPAFQSLHRYSSSSYPQRSHAELPDGLLERLGSIVSGRLTTSPSALDTHGRDVSFHPVQPPDVVLFPHSTKEVAEVVAECHRTGTPVIPFGSGSSLESHVGARFGGVCLDLSQMNNIVEVNVEDMDCKVQAGVTRLQLNQHLRSFGLSFPVDPGADATLGGMASTRASGTNAVRYGTMRENVMGLTVVLSDGRIAKCGGRAKKSSAGYDLTHLMVGSEGTLGVITELVLRLHPLPQAVSAAVCCMPDMESAVTAVTMIMQSNVPVARIELLDDLSIDAVNRYSKTELELAPSLFFEFHGSEAGVKEQAELVGEITTEMGGKGFKWASQPEDRTKLWSARHSAYWACLALRPGCTALTTDVCVPISQLSTAVLEAQAEAQKLQLQAPLVGHVGDGNFHLLILVEPGNEKELHAAKALADFVARKAIAVGGTCTGEHGIGSGKLKYLELEHGRGAVEMMHSVKMALDPKNIMNPGKLGSHPSMLK